MQRVFRQNTVLSATAAIALLFTGCGESKVSQCNKIVKVANQSVTVSQELSKNPKAAKGSKALTEFADKLDQFANNMKSLEIKDEKLQGFQGRFLQLYQNSSKALRDTATALNKKDLPAANRSLESLKKSSNEETTIVNEINSYCSGK